MKTVQNQKPVTGNHPQSEIRLKIRLKFLDLKIKKMQTRLKRGYFESERKVWQQFNSLTDAFNFCKHKFVSDD